MKVAPADAKGVKLAIQYLKAGKSVVYPTDTAYGLGVDATNRKAVRRLYRIKERGASQPVHVIVSSLAMARRFAKLNKMEEKIFRKFMPGALTIVLESRISNMEYGKILSAGTGTLGIRVPDNEVALALVKKLNRPVTTPSANPRGGPAPYSAEASLKQFIKKRHRPDLFLDAGKLKKKKTSTLVRISDGEIKILRKGPITRTQLQKCID